MSNKKTRHGNQHMHDLEVEREGITSLAAWHALDPDKESLIYRKFGYLATRRSLHLQNKLIELEDKLDKVDTQIREGDAEAKKSLRKHEVFEDRATDKSTIDGQRMTLLDEIDVVLTKYYETLLIQADVANLKAPRPRAIQAYRSYVDGAGEEDRIIYGKAQDHLLDDEQDLIALHTPADVDLLSTILQDRWPQTFAKRRARPGKSTLIFQESKVQRVVAIINILVASILIIGAVVSLYKLRNQSDSVRLGSIATFTALFSISLGILTNAKRAEIFAATAAYAAVLVVFVSGDLGTSGGGNQSSKTS